MSTVISTVLIIAFFSYVIKSKPLSGPAAVGLGLASMTAILVLGIYAVNFLDELFSFPEKGIPFYAVMSFFLVTFMLFLAGYAASKTWENTVTMNVKIVMVIGLIPFIFIALMSFSNISLWFVLACLVVYIPSIWGGHLWFNYHQNKVVAHDNS
ncbi:hypothetical protein [Pseudoalteromonas sp. BDTF-M6]|uniref:hypothetical protein n=1 Tax=Pseudoalteromonas sp. BDTF-M6 TaxID=2796132 RepID=UPI001BAEB9FF|nr:hypothetical protein [Pseudoalteromonas sp. BDTF-M6]MBS3796531.1 hypothetical protein [Pseudoalteromonas sp. BDTF-M6]